MVRWRSGRCVGKKKRQKNSGSEGRGCPRMAAPLNADERRRETGRSGSGCQKSRLNLWLIEREFSRVDGERMEKLDVQLMANIALVPLYLPPGNRLQSDCASCFSCSLLGQFLSNLEPVPRVLLPAYHRLAPSSPRVPPRIFSENPRTRSAQPLSFPHRSPRFSARKSPNVALENPTDP